jgi:hypothetical protein
VKVCVPMSVGSEMFAAFTEMVLAFESLESEIKAAVGVKAAVIPQTIAGYKF